MAVLSGQRTVTTAGTEVQITSSSTPANCAVLVKALTTNSGLIYLGQVNGTLDSTNGLPLAAGDVVIFDTVGNLQEIWVDSAVNGEGVAWLLLSA